MNLFKDRMGKPLTWSQAFAKILTRFANYWLDFKLFILKLVGLVPSHVIRKLFYEWAGIKIGTKSTIHTGASFFETKNIQIGKDTVVGVGAFLDGRAALVIGDHVNIASEVMIYNSEHDINSPDFSATLGKVEVEDYTFVGPRAIILPGVKVGRGAVIGAGAVVTRDVPEFTVVGGVPAKIIGERKNKNPNYKIGRARLFQ